MLPNADKGAITGIEDKFTRTLEKKNYEQDTPKNHDLREVEWRFGNEQKKGDGIFIPSPFVYIE